MLFVLLKGERSVLQIFVLERPGLPSDRAFSLGRISATDTCEQWHKQSHLLAESDDCRQPV